MARYRRARTPGGSFFFTVNLARRDSALLVEHIDAFRACYGKMSGKMPFSTLAVCILPDHLHAIWQLPEDDGDFSSSWSAIKAGFSRTLPELAGRSQSKVSKREKGIWQRRFWERLIRDEEDLRRHVDYIHFNPVKHGLVTRACDWPYSSFHRHVRLGNVSRDWAGTVADEGFGERG